MAPALAHFGGSVNQTYWITSAGVAPYEILIGTTDVAKVDRTISFTVSSPTGATAGTQYTLDNTTGSVVIPAGQAAAIVKVQGRFDEYVAGRKDTLVFKIQEGTVPTANFQNEVKLYMRGPCFDGDIADISVIAGDYENTVEPGWGPYTTSVTGVTQTAPGLATGFITNLYDTFGALSANFDWTNPAQTKVTIPLQATPFTASGYPLYVRSSPSPNVSLFSVCNDNMVVYIDVLALVNPPTGFGAYDMAVKIEMSR